jgi:hydroxymethylpyrimidine/phosphomethylpyrimidine kinase
MVSTSGYKLVADNSIDVIINKLIPLAKVITPNIFEAELLLNKKLTSIKEMEKFAFELLKFGSESVLLKGGHLKEEKIIDVFVSKDLDNSIIISKNKIKTTNIHGTGCTLSAALTTLLTKKYDWHKTINLLEEYINKVIMESCELNIGKGNGPLNHFVS